MESFRNQIVGKLKQLTQTQQSIESTSSWCLFYSKEARTVVQVWDSELSRLPADKKLTQLYLANHILQEGKKKGREYQEEFSKVIARAIRDAYSNGDEKTRKGVDRLLDVWAERKVFSSSVVKELKEAQAAAKDSRGRSKDRPSSHSAPADTSKLQVLGVVADLMSEVLQAQTKSQQQNQRAMQLKQNLHMEGSHQEVSDGLSILEGCISSLQFEAQMRQRLSEELQKLMNKQDEALFASQSQLTALSEQQQALSSRLHELKEQEEQRRRQEQLQKQQAMQAQQQQQQQQQQMGMGMMGPGPGHAMNGGHMGVGMMQPRPPMGPGLMQPPMGLPGGMAGMNPILDPAMLAALSSAINASGAVIPPPQPPSHPPPAARPPPHEPPSSQQPQSQPAGAPPQLAVPALTPDAAAAAASQLVADQQTAELIARALAAMPQEERQRLAMGIASANSGGLPDSEPGPSSAPQSQPTSAPGSQRQPGSNSGAPAQDDFMQDTDFQQYILGEGSEQGTQPEEGSPQAPAVAAADDDDYDPENPF